MTTPIDGLQQFNEWYATVPSSVIDSMLGPLNAMFDAAIIEHQASSTFLPYPLTSG